MAETFSIPRASRSRQRTLRLRPWSTNLAPSTSAFATGESERSRSHSVRRWRSHGTTAMRQAQSSIATTPVTSSPVRRFSAGAYSWVRSRHREGIAITSCASTPPVYFKSSPNHWTSEPDLALRRPRPASGRYTKSVTVELCNCERSRTPFPHRLSGGGVRGMLLCAGARLGDGPRQSARYRLRHSEARSPPWQEPRLDSGRGGAKCVCVEAVDDAVRDGYREGIAVPSATPAEPHGQACGQIARPHRSSGKYA